MTLNSNSSIPQFLIYICQKLEALVAGSSGGSSGGLTDTQLRASPLDVAGPLTDTQLRAAAVPVSGALTDSELRASAIQVVGPVTNSELRSANVGVTIPKTPTATIVTVDTPVVGTDWAAFGSLVCSAVDIVNTTGTDIRYRRGGAGAYLVVKDGSSRLVIGITNANQVSVQRDDTSNTQVTVRGETIE